VPNCAAPSTLWIPQSCRPSDARRSRAPEGSLSRAPLNGSIVGRTDGMLRTAIAIALEFVGNSAAFAAVVAALPRTGGGGGLNRLVPAVVLLGFSALAIWGSSRLWRKWRLGTGVCSIFQAVMSFQLSHQIPPEHETGNVGHNYLVAAIVLVVVGLAAVAWHQRLASRSA
jgi:hypothetical protein